MGKPPARTESDVGIPVLAFEVHSAGTRERDRSVKSVKYLAAGVAEVWLVDPVARTLTVGTTRGSFVCRDADRARSQALRDVELVPREGFADV